MVVNIVVIIHKNHNWLGGVISILKNDGVRQGEGLSWIIP